MHKVRLAPAGFQLAAAIAAILGGAAAYAAPAPAPAAPSAGGLEEVVVTATRREESLQSVPLAVSAITANALEQRNINSIADLKVGTIPGLFVTVFSGTPSVPIITMRGVGLSDPTQGTVEMTTPVYIDGVFLGRAQGLGLDLIEPERIEVLRGPQGQLFGRNAEGGVVQFVTRKPSGEFGAKVSAGFGNYGEQRFKASVDLPKFGGFAVQLSGVKTKHDPYTPQFSGAQTYVAPGPTTGYSALDVWGGRVAVRWTNDSNFTADYSYDKMDDTDSQAYLSWVPVGTLVNPATPQSNVPTNNDFPSSTFNRQYNPAFKVKASGHALTLAYEASEHATFKSITSYRDASRFGGSNLAAPLQAGLSSSGFLHAVAIENISQHQFSQELQFVGTWSSFDLTAGGVYYTENVNDQRISQITGPGLVAPVTFISPAGLAFCTNFRLDPCQTGDNRQRAETKSAGVYAQGTWRATDQLNVIVGARYSDDKKTGLRYSA